MDNPQIKSLKDLEGSEIEIVLPGLDATKLQRVILHRVESAGLWLEVQGMTNDILRAVKQHSSSKTPIFFFPWHAVTMIVESFEKTSLDEGSFGL